MKVRLLGIPVEDGAGRMGCEMGPSAYRTAGIVEAIADLGHEVEDLGNVARGPLASVKPADVAELAFPLLIAFLFGIVGIALFAGLTGKLLGYSVPMSIAIGLTSLYGFPGTMILSQEAAKGAGETPEEVAAIEGDILPKMIIAGFSTVTITSVVVTSIIAAGIGG